MSLYKRLIEMVEPKLTPRKNGPWENKRPGLPADKSVIPPEHILAVIRAQKESIPEKLRSARYQGSSSTGIRDALRKYAPQDYDNLSHVHGAGAVRSALSKLVKEKKLLRVGDMYREPPTEAEKQAADAKAALKATREKQAQQAEAHAKKTLGAGFVRATRKGKQIELTVLLDLDDPSLLKKIGGLS